MNATNMIIITVALVLQCLTFYKYLDKLSEINELEQSAEYWRNSAKEWADRYSKLDKRKKKTSQQTFTINCDVDQVVKKVMQEMKERFECLD